MIENLIDTLNKYNVLINSVATILSITISAVTVILTYNKSKKEQKRFENESEINRAQYEETLRTQREQFEVKLEQLEKFNMIQEQPWLVLKGEDFSVETNDAGRIILEFCFINKGRGAAYSLKPAVECEAITMNEKRCLRRYESVQSPIVMVGECCKLKYFFIDNKPMEDFELFLKFLHKDASGRQYRQVFRIIACKNHGATAMDYADPEFLQSEEDV